MRWIIDRFKEPSTKNALGLGLTIGAQIAPTYAPLFLAIAGLLAGRAATQPG